MSQSKSTETDPNMLDVLIMGAGFSGLYLLHRLRQKGFKVKLFEADAGLGGVWYSSRYPGARVDSHVPNYEYSMEEVWRDWTWTERFPGAEELQRYFKHVDDQLNLSCDIRFQSRISKASYDEDQNFWQIVCEDGSQTQTRFFVSCVGFAAKSYTPEIPGIEDFKGDCHHTAHWPAAGLDLSEKRVGVIGTGASGVQVIQEAAKVATHLTVFQRTPMIALPMQQRQLDAGSQQRAKDEYKDIFQTRNASGGGIHDVVGDKRSALDISKVEREKVLEHAWLAGGFHCWAPFVDSLTNLESNRMVYDFWRAKTLARLDDPKLAKILAPKEPPHPFGAKRPALEQRYYEIFNQRNVELIDIKESPIEMVTETGISIDHRHIDLDILVMATGYDAITGGLTNFEINGTADQTLAETWSTGVSTQLGVGVPGFPNFLMIYGAQSPTSFWNGPTSAEVQGDWLVDCLCYLRDNDKQKIEATVDGAVAWGDHMKALADSTLLPMADSWYMGANIPGKPRQLLNYLGANSYMAHCNASAEAGYLGFKLT